MGNYHAFVFDGGRMVDLGTMGGSNSWAYGVNDNGWMVGASGMPMTNLHGFLCTNAMMNPGMMDLNLFATGKGSKGVKTVDWLQQIRLSEAVWGCFSRVFAPSRSRYSCSHEAPCPGAGGCAGAAARTTLRAPSDWATGAIGRSWRVATGGSGIRRCATGGGGGGWADLGTGGGKGLDRDRKVWQRVEGLQLRVGRGLRAGIAGSGGAVAPGSGPAWMRSWTAAEAWGLWPTD